MECLRSYLEEAKMQNSNRSGGMTQLFGTIKEALLFAVVSAAFLMSECYGAVIEETISIPSNGSITLMWQVPADIQSQELNLMKSAGVNVIHHINAAKWTDKQLKSYLDQASMHDMRVIIYIGSLLEHRGGGWIFTSKASDFISKWKTHPALFAWHTFDEPIADDRKADKYAQEKIYREIKLIDPSTPVIVSLNLTEGSQWDDFFSEQAFDFLEIHAYVNRGIGDRQRRLIEFFSDRKTKNYPVIVSLRAFNNWKGRDELKPDGLLEQYRFFKNAHITNSFGYYGWRLGIFTGISQQPELMNQFIKVTTEHLRAGTK